MVVKMTDSETLKDEIFKYKQVKEMSGTKSGCGSSFIQIKKESWILQTNGYKNSKILKQ